MWERLNLKYHFKFTFLLCFPEHQITFTIPEAEGPCVSKREREREQRERKRERATVERKREKHKETRDI